MSSWRIKDKAAHRHLMSRMRRENASQSSKTPRNDVERQGGILSDHQARYDACRGHEITPFFPTCLLSFLTWPRHYFQSNYLSSTPAFRLSSFASPPCCLPPFLWSLTCFLRWGWNILIKISKPPPPASRSSLLCVYGLAQGTGEVLV